MSIVSSSVAQMLFLKREKETQNEPRKGSRVHLPIIALLQT